MEFEQLKTIFIHLEKNISVLERELGDISKFCYQTDNGSDFEGIKVLKRLSEELEERCNELEELNKQDEADICEINKELIDSKHYVAELEERQQEFENILIQHNLLEPDNSEQPHKDLEHDVSSYEKFLHERKPFKSPLAPQVADSPVNSTFLVARIPSQTIQQLHDFNKENLSDLQNTICDFQEHKQK
ncbi:coiled-coil domain-containing protein 150-like [Homalodisca vitripennis]|uniref:coiled-coil domain-containing protein 150-like n=1 Tax=Homalodisca vitripennis TaxID=197043 RepID=UPI001EECBF55|nr:coiled-coil domain-containing protein 150-like [Homalodisca vitripennis]